MRFSWNETSSTAKRKTKFLSHHKCGKTAHASAPAVGVLPTSALTSRLPSFTSRSQSAAGEHQVLSWQVNSLIGHLASCCSAPSEPRGATDPSAAHDSKQGSRVVLENKGLAGERTFQPLAFFSTFTCSLNHQSHSAQSR